LIWWLITPHLIVVDSSFSGCFYCLLHAHVRLSESLQCNWKCICRSNVFIQSNLYIFLHALVQKVVENRMRGCFEGCAKKRRLMARKARNPIVDYETGVCIQLGIYFPYVSCCNQALFLRSGYRNHGYL
jgi:hypothetical protein